jgi:uncharacterized protein YggU (UPF0235/DUF167 family)
MVKDAWPPRGGGAAEGGAIAADSAWRAREGGLEVRVRVTPRGGRDAVDGTEALADGRRILKVRVRAAPEDGAANQGVRRLLAKALRRPVSAVTLAAGATARVKTFWIAGEAGSLASALAVLAEDRGA